MKMSCFHPDHLPQIARIFAEQVMGNLSVNPPPIAMEVREKNLCPCLPKRLAQAGDIFVRSAGKKIRG